MMLKNSSAGFGMTGERGEVVITAVRGLGERLVSGDEWVVRGDGASCRRESEGAITAEQAVKIAELARGRALRLSAGHRVGDLRR